MIFLGYIYFITHVHLFICTCYKMIYYNEYYNSKYVFYIKVNNIALYDTTLQTNINNIDQYME
jgi:hypothetical protein